MMAGAVTSGRPYSAYLVPIRLHTHSHHQHGVFIVISLVQLRHASHSNRLVVLKKNLFLIDYPTETIVRIQL